ncbi:T9SS type A sorting domain-containing protein [Hymenobacter cellulosivorans]|uniref:T9SS type A sorting domain-containing protein n=1 Tax=Hymenobacter cellulosivorans TaxID=2932249 RepID=A0ABY4FES6_9BACT|nr:T9SS type A sorting domain-containing protein [Hymenobacter cellulosivorans]UOQ54631.1 T9SS type A sorting domain-containing protein [Hymenobacter cellulosivorans]
MPTSPQKLFLSLLGLLTLTVADAQAQTTPAKRVNKLTSLVSHKHDGAERVTTAARGTKATVVRPGQAVYYSWDTPTGRWSVSSKQTFAYDSQGRVTQSTYQDSLTATNYDRTQYTYTAQGQWASETRQSWMNNAWVNIERTLYTYNAQGKETSYTRQDWTNGAWVNNSRYLTDYDSYGNETLYQGQEWLNGSWVTDYADKSLYTYNSAGLVTQEVRQELDNGTFVNTDRITFTYANGQWTSLTFEEWDNDVWVPEERILDFVWFDWAKQRPASYREQIFDGTTFVDDERISISYTANGGYVEVEQQYLNGVWVNEDRDTEVYDSQGNEQLYTYEEWVNNAWRQTEGNRYINVYNASNTLLRKVTQEFSNTTRQYVNTYRENYSSFQTITLAARNAALEAQSALYPNPASGVVTLEVAGLSKAEAATGEVRNALGQLVQNFTVQPQAGKLSTQLDLSNLKSGVYTVRLQTADGAVVKRVVRN